MNEDLEYLEVDGEEQELEEHYGLSEDVWLAICRTEREESVGFGGYSEELIAKRERALKYVQGDTTLKKVKGRSQVTDSAASDAVETLMPELMEIFTGGDDVATFRPISQDDEERAHQETRAVRHIVMEENNGFELVYDYCKDASILCLGLFKVSPKSETTETKQIIKAADPLLLQEFEGVEGIEAEVKAAYPDGTIDIEVIETRDDKRVAVEVVAPEDFTVARDTVELRDTTYCAQRGRARAQTLIVDGFDADKVMRLQYTEGNDDADREARKTVEPDGTDNEGNPALKRMKMVEYHEHYVRVNPEEDGGKLRLFQVFTDVQENILLSVEEVDNIPFADGTPIRNPHKFYGTSIVDLMIEVQDIKTSLYRLLLDSGYFAMNQRHEIVMRGATNDTVKDYQNNIPGGGIRVKDAGTINPVGNASLGFDVVQAIEAIAVMGEERSGISRHSQGLNPDTLHDTAKGAQILINAAQKRTRLIARLLACGIRNMYLLVHDLQRTIGRELTLRLNGEYVQVDPTRWGSRKDMTIAIAVGSGGREEKLGALESVLQKQAEIAAQQGGLGGPLVTADNVYDALQDYTREAGLKGEEKYWTNPEKAPPQEPEPDPEMEKAKMDAQLKQQEMAQKQQQAVQDAQLRRDEAAAKLDLARQEATAKAQLAQQNTAADIQLQEQKAQAEFALAQQRFDFESRLAAMQAQQANERAKEANTAKVEMSKNRAGGDLNK